MTCEARQINEEMRCARCGFAWDANDPDPPACRKKAVALPDVAAHKVEQSIPATTVAALRHNHKAQTRVRADRRVSTVPVEVERRAVDRLPAELPSDLAHDMLMSILAHPAARGGIPTIEGVRAAYRVLLDRLGE